MQLVNSVKRIGLALLDVVSTSVTDNSRNSSDAFSVGTGRVSGHVQGGFSLLI